MRYHKYGIEDHCEIIYFVQLSDSPLPLKLSDETDQIWPSVSELCQLDTKSAEYLPVDSKFYETRSYKPQIATLPISGNCPDTDSPGEYYLSGA